MNELAYIHANKVEHLLMSQVFLVVAECDSNLKFMFPGNIIVYKGKLFIINFLCLSLVFSYHNFFITLFFINT